MSNLSQQSNKSIIIKGHQKLIVINTDEISILTAVGSYTNIRLENGKEIFTSKPLKYYETTLPIDQFYRCHKSFIINLGRFIEYSTNKHKAIVSNIKVPVSRRKRANLVEALSKWISHYEKYEPVIKKMSR